MRKTIFRNEAVCPITLWVFSVVMTGHIDGGATVEVTNETKGTTYPERECADLDDALTYGNTVAANIRRRKAKFWEVDS